MIDPNETLAEMRALANAMLADQYEIDADDATRFIERFQSLDAWLKRGGYLPTDWEQKP